MSARHRGSRGEARRLLDRVLSTIAFHILRQAFRIFDEQHAQASWVCSDFFGTWRAPHPCNSKTVKDVNHSPFLAHSTHSVHQPRWYPVISCTDVNGTHTLPRLMEGVRRWISTYPASHSKKLHGKPVSKIEVTRDVIEPELNPHSTEAIARQLLDPVVSEEEEEEYQGYVILCLVSTTTYVKGSVDTLINAKNWWGLW